MRKSYKRSSVLKDFGQWVVTKYGVECSTTYYAISMKDLKRDGRDHWLEHMDTKSWVWLGSFRDAYDWAMRNLPIENRPVAELVQAPR